MNDDGARSPGMVLILNATTRELQVDTLGYQLRYSVIEHRKKANRSKSPATISRRTLKRDLGPWLDQRQTDAAKQIAEALFRANRIKHRIDGEIRHPDSTVTIGSLKPLVGLLLIIQSGV